MSTELEVGGTYFVAITQRPVDELERAVAFARDLVALRGRWHKVAMHAAGFVRRYARRLSPMQLAAGLSCAAFTCLPSLASSPFSPRLRRPALTYYAPTEHVDDFYRPVMPVRPELERYFRPTLITDADGRLAEDVAADLLPAVAAPAPVPTQVGVRA